MIPVQKMKSVKNEDKSVQNEENEVFEFEERTRPTKSTLATSDSDYLPGQNTKNETMKDKL